MNPYDESEHQGKRRDQVEFSATVCFWCLVVGLALAFGFLMGSALAVGMWLWRLQ